MAYYDALIAKWPGVVGTTTADKLASLNAETMAGPVQGVPVVTVMTYLWTNGLWLPMLAAAQAGTSNGAIAAVALLEDRTRETIDFSLPTATALLADLVSNSLLSQAQSDAIVAMGTPQVPWWRANGYALPISLGDLAMAGIEGTAWRYKTISATMNAGGETVATIQFWPDDQPDAILIRTVQSVTLTDEVIADFAARTARDLATRAILAAGITLDAVN